MKKGSGVYNVKFIWLQQTSSQDSTIGAPKETWSNNGELWGSYEAVRAYEKVAYGMKGSFVDINIKIHQFPDVKFVDRLQDKETEQVYQISGITEGENELVITAVRLGDQ